MAYSRPIQAALGVAAALAFLAGCSNGGSSPAPLAGTQSVARELSSSTLTSGAGLSGDLSGAGGIVMGQRLMTPSWMSPQVVALAAKKQLLYVSVFAAGYVNIYDQRGKNQQPIGQITGLTDPNGLYADSKGDLWVANEGANDILEFLPGHKMPSKTLLDPAEYPASIDIDSKGTVFVANLTTTSGAAGSISVYTNGSTSVSYMITDPNFVRGNSVLVDANDKVYATNNLAPYPTGPGEVITFAAGSHGPGTLTKIALKYGGDEHFDKTGDFLVSDLVTPSVDVFELPRSKPAKVYAQTGEPYRFAFNAAETSFFISNPLNAEVDQISYPAGKLLNKITGGLNSTDQPIGIATIPADPAGN